MRLLETPESHWNFLRREWKGLAQPGKHFVPQGEGSPHSPKGKGAEPLKIIGPCKPSFASPCPYLLLGGVETSLLNATGKRIPSAQSGCAEHRGGGAVGSGVPEGSGPPAPSPCSRIKDADQKILHMSRLTSNTSASHCTVSVLSDLFST